MVQTTHIILKLSQTNKHGWGHVSSGPKTNNRNGWASISASENVVDSSESPSVWGTVKTSKAVSLIDKNDTTILQTNNHGWGRSSTDSETKHRNGWDSDVSPAVVSPSSSSKQNSLKTSKVIVQENDLNISSSQTHKHGWGRVSSGPKTNSLNGWAPYLLLRMLMILLSLLRSG